MKNVQEGLRRFKEVEEDIGFQKVLNGSRIEKGFKKVLHIKRRFKNIKGESIPKGIIVN